MAQMERQVKRITGYATTKPAPTRVNLKSPGDMLSNIAPKGTPRTTGGIDGKNASRVSKAYRLMGGM